VTRKLSTTRKKGKVIGQKPKAGKTLPLNSKVNVIVGRGPRHR
jgi:beta-lactam-binding protein with PASTA domain